MAILTDLHDPRVRDVTVTGVEVSPDMRQAKVFVSVMGNEAKQNLSLRGLQSAAGFLQSKVAKRIDTRYTPKLLFVLDLGVKKSIEVVQILHRELKKDAKDDDSTADEHRDDEAVHDRLRHDADEQDLEQVEEEPPDDSRDRR